MLPYDYKNTSTPHKSLFEAETERVASEQQDAIDVEEVLTDLAAVLDKISCDMEAKNVDDVRKRMWMMESKWKANELNSHVQVGMAKIAKCLSVQVKF